VLPVSHELAPLRRLYPLPYFSVPLRSVTSRLLLARRTYTRLRAEPLPSASAAWLRASSVRCLLRARAFGPANTTTRRASARGSGRGCGTSRMGRYWPTYRPRCRVCDGEGDGKHSGRRDKSGQMSTLRDCRDASGAKRHLVTRWAVWHRRSTSSACVHWPLRGRAFVRRVPRARGRALSLVCGSIFIDRTSPKDTAS
jgi:hypothetical protein